MCVVRKIALLMILVGSLIPTFANAGGLRRLDAGEARVIDPSPPLPINIIRPIKDCAPDITSEISVSPVKRRLDNNAPAFGFSIYLDEMTISTKKDGSLEITAFVDEQELFLDCSEYEVSTTYQTSFFNMTPSYVCTIEDPMTGKEDITLNIVQEYEADKYCLSSFEDRTAVSLLESKLDTDGDFYPDSEDNCPKVANPDQQDLNRDDVGDDCSTIKNIADNVTRTSGGGSCSMDPTASTAGEAWLFYVLAGGLPVIAVMLRRRQVGLPTAMAGVRREK